MGAQNLEQKFKKNIGAHEKMFTDGLKELHTEEQSYHGKLLCLKKVIYVLFFSGGSLNGKDCEKILRSALNSKEVKDCPILVCISKTMGDRADKYLTLFKVLGNVWTTLRMPNDKIDDEDLAVKSSIVKNGVNFSQNCFLREILQGRDTHSVCTFQNI